eukprot:18772-Pyramimonas_sp.AAC.1
MVIVVQSIYGFKEHRLPMAKRTWCLDSRSLLYAAFGGYTMQMGAARYVTKWHIQLNYRIGYPVNNSSTDDMQATQRMRRPIMK